MPDPEANTIWKHWQPLVGVASFLVSVGFFLSEIKTMKTVNDEIKDRQDRQFQLYQTIEKDVAKLKEEAAYQRGLHDAKKHNE